MLRDLRVVFGVVTESPNFGTASAGAIRTTVPDQAHDSNLVASARNPCCVRRWAEIIARVVAASDLREQDVSSCLPEYPPLLARAPGQVRTTRSS